VLQQSVFRAADVARCARELLGETVDELEEVVLA
jgi:hypothetical protein